MSEQGPKPPAEAQNTEPLQNAEVAHAHHCTAECSHGESMDRAAEVVDNAELDPLAPITETKITPSAEATEAKSSDEHENHICSSHCSHGESLDLANEIFSQPESNPIDSKLELSTEADKPPARPENTVEAQSLAGAAAEQEEPIASEAPRTETDTIQHEADIHAQEASVQSTESEDVRASVESVQAETGQTETLPDTEQTHSQTESIEKGATEQVDAADHAARESAETSSEQINEAVTERETAAAEATPVQEAEKPSAESEEKSSFETPNEAKSTLSAEYVQPDIDTVEASTTEQIDAVEHAAHENVETSTEQAKETTPVASAEQAQDTPEDGASETAENSAEAEFSVPEAATDEDIAEIFSNIESLESAQAEQVTEAAEVAPEKPVEEGTNETVAYGTEELSVEDALANVESAFEYDDTEAEDTEILEAIAGNKSAAVPKSEANEATPRANIAEGLNEQTIQIAQEIEAKPPQSKEEINLLLEQYDITANEQQLEIMLQLLERGEIDQIQEYISGLLKLEHDEFQQEFLKNIDDDDYQRFQQQAKQQRLSGLLRVLLPKLFNYNSPTANE